MTVAWTLEAIFYAALALCVVLINWHRRHTRVGGFALLAFSVISSLTFFLHLRFELLLIREMLLVTVVATVCAGLYFVGDGRRCYRIALAACALDVAFCGALCWVGSATDTVRSLFGWVVNSNFWVLCACVSWPGARDAYDAWIGGISRVRSVDSSTTDFDWAIRHLDR